MFSSARKQQVRTTSKKELKNSLKITLKEAIRLINEIHETTDKKLQEISAFCMDKKCNE